MQYSRKENVKVFWYQTFHLSFYFELGRLEVWVKYKENNLSPSHVWVVKLFYKVALHQSYDKVHSKVFLSTSERFNWDYFVCCLFVAALNANADKLDKHQKIFICKWSFMGEELEMLMIYVKNGQTLEKILWKTSNLFEVCFTILERNLEVKFFVASIIFFEEFFSFLKRKQN